MNRDWDEIADGLAFPEALRWHDDALWFSDIFGRAVHRVVDEKCETVVELDDLPSGLGWRADDTMLVVGMRTRQLFAVRDARVEVAADLAPLVTGDCNDMLVDAAGRAYVGDFGYDYAGGAERAPAHITAVEPDGTSRTVAEDVWFPNGMALVDDGHTLLVAETPQSRITAFTVTSTGDLADRRTYASFDTARPDGICVDAEGALWLASPGTGELLRIARDGRLLESLLLPDNRPAQTCVLGGQDGRTLYVATTTTHDEHDCVRDRPGRVLGTRTAVPAAHAA